MALYLGTFVLSHVACPIPYSVSSNGCVFNPSWHIPVSAACVEPGLPYLFKNETLMLLVWVEYLGSLVSHPCLSHRESYLLSTVLFSTARKTTDRALYDVWYLRAAQYVPSLFLQERTADIIDG